MKIFKSDKPRFRLLLLLLLISTAALAQPSVYVNTNNLILRDRPQKIYRVFAIFHAPCQVNVLPYGKEYRKIKAVTDRFFKVSYTQWDEAKRSTLISGWVDKRYVVATKAEVKSKDADTAKVLATIIPSIPFMGPDEGNPNKLNCAEYPYPKYKGGEKHFDKIHTQKIYHKGPHGGCYYIGPKGQKRYVDSKMCK